jgi:uncharacterized membrane protein
MWWTDYWPMPGMLFAPMLMFFLFFVCLAVVGMIDRSRGGHAVEILKERYARGEINQVEFEERRRLLGRV